MMTVRQRYSRPQQLEKLPLKFYLLIPQLHQGGRYRKAATIGGARGNPIRKTGKDRGTGSLPKKKTRYWW